jgi:hypothetical protein
MRENARVLHVFLTLLVAGCERVPIHAWRASFDGAPQPSLHFYLVGSSLESDYLVSSGTGREWSAHFPLRAGEAPALDALGGAGDDGPITLTLERDAGTLTLVGMRTGNSAGGTYTWTPNAAFAEALPQLGYEAPSELDMVALALLDVSLEFLRDIDERGYGPLDGYWLRAWALADVDPERLDSVTARGYRQASQPELMALSRLPLSFLDAVAEAGLDDPRGLSAVDLWQAGVTEAQVREFVARGLSDRPASDLVTLLRGGIDAELAEAARELGASRASDIVGLREQGIDASIISELRERLGDTLTWAGVIGAHRLRLLRRLALPPTDLWVFEPDPTVAGGAYGARRLTDDAATYDWPRVSPDGRRVVATELSPQPSLLVFDLASPAPPSVVARTEAWMPAWSPDGSRIAFGAGGLVWTASTSGGAPRAFPSSGWQGWIAWAPGSSILYLRNNLGWYSVLDPATEYEAPFGYRPGRAGPGWAYVSPSGDAVAIAVTGSSRGVVVAQATGTSGRMLLEGPWSPIGWTADGEAVLVMQLAEGGTTEVWQARSSDGERSLFATLPVPVGAEQATAGPGGLTIVAVRER